MLKAPPPTRKRATSPVATGEANPLLIAGLPCHSGRGGTCCLQSEVPARTLLYSTSLASAGVWRRSFEPANILETSASPSMNSARTTM